MGDGYADGCGGLAESNLAKAVTETEMSDYLRLNLKQGLL